MRRGRGRLLGESELPEQSNFRITDDFDRNVGLLAAYPQRRAVIR
jgi:hypothetical protein